MNWKNVVWNYISVVLAAGVVIFCWAMVKSVDLMRMEMERVRASLQEIQEQMGQGTSAVSGTAVSAAAEPEAANAQYYDPEAEQGGRIVYASAADSGNLNSIVSSDSQVSSFWSLAMDSLAEPDYGDPNLYKPMLAESWSLSDDKLVWTIKLRRGILWHDFKDPVTGKEWKNIPVTAHDFKFYLDVVKDETVDALPLRGYFASIQEIKVINDLEFQVVWNEKYFLSKDITLGLTPLPRHLYNADGKFSGARFNGDTERNRMIVGCGPYQFVRWENGKRVTFRRFEKYYGKRLGIMPPIRQISFDLIKHPGTRLQALVSKDLDNLNLSPEQWINNTSGAAFDEKTGWIRKIKYPAYAYSYIGLNQKNPLFQDKKVRQALSHLIDRKRILKDVYFDLARPVSGPFFPDSPAYDKSIAPYAFSVETAKKLLAEAGWKDTDGDGVLDKDGEPFHFTILNPNVNTTYQKILPILKEDMAKAGIRMDALSLEWSVVLERIDKRHFDAAMIGWTSGMRPDPYQLWHSGTADLPSSSNFISFRNREADKLIEAIRVEFNDAEREKLYHAFHKLIHEEAPYLFLFSPYNLNALSSRYRNVRVFPGGIPDRLLWTPSKQQLSVPGM